MFHCHLNYALLAWGSASKGTLDPIIKKQKNAIRLISEANFNAHTDPLFKESEILKFEDLYEFSQIEFMYLYLNDKLPLSFDGVWSKIRENKTLNLRNAGDLFIPRARLDFSARLPLHSFPRVFNAFPDKGLQYSENLKKFKGGLKSFYLNNLPSEVNCGRPFCKDCFPNQL